MTTALQIERLRALYRYEPATGNFIRLIAIGHHDTHRAGKISGCVCKKSGYVLLRIDGTLYRAHRLAWLYMTGEWPVNDVDHENRVRSDNRWANLRPATRAQNLQNRITSRGRAGLLGVRTRSSGRFNASITVDGRTHDLGWFSDPHTAHATYLVAKASLHPFWAGS